MKKVFIETEVDIQFNKSEQFKDKDISEDGYTLLSSLYTEINGIRYYPWTFNFIDKTEYVLAVKESTLRMLIQEKYVE